MPVGQLNSGGGTFEPPGLEQEKACRHFGELGISRTLSTNVLSNARASVIDNSRLNLALGMSGSPMETWHARRNSSILRHSARSVLQILQILCRANLLQKKAGIYEPSNISEQAAKVLFRAQPNQT